MCTNSVTALFNQQYGFSPWAESDPLMHRFHCEQQNSYLQLLESNEDEEYYRDTPIFACKSALKDGNENFLAMANEDGKLAVHNCETRQRHGTTAHNNAIFDLAWMFDQMKIVTASGDHTSKLYDFCDGDFREVRMFCGHTRSVKTVSFRKDDSSVFATGSRDGNIILWDIRTSQNSFISKADQTIVNSHGGKDIGTPSKPRKKNVMPSNSGVKSVTGLVFQNENTLISCGAGDGVIKIWDLRKHYNTSKKEPLPKYTIPYTGNTAKNGFSNLVIDSAGIKLYANCLDNTIYCYNVATYNPEPVMRYTGHQNSTFYIKSSLCKTGNYLVSGSSDENAYVWNTKFEQPIVKLTGHSAEVTCVAWCSRSNYSLVTCSDDMTHRIWTVCGENCTDNSRGQSEILPLSKIKQRPIRKRLLAISDKTSPKKPIWQCQNCQKATTFEPFCENCVPKSTKRKADTELWHENKRMTTEFGPRRLFARLNTNPNDFNHEEHTFKLIDDRKDDTIDLKSLNTALDAFKPSKNPNRSYVPTSPTINLPNYVVDGTAPHLNYSPPKRKAQDWLTRMRIERNLRQEMLEKTVGASSPKMPKMELTPRSKRSWTTPKSPLLRFFKVTNSNGKCDGGSCSPKAHGCNFLGQNGCEQLSQ